MQVQIIAEAGVNHNGKLEMAIELVDLAIKAGADIVKFQTFTIDELVTKNAPKANYQSLTTGEDESQLDMLQKLTLSFEDFIKIKNYCLEKKIEFLTTSFGPISTDFISNLELERFKIPSGEITNYPYLKRFGSYQKPIILSTGMSDMQEINDALSVLLSSGMSLEKITLLHCISEYPTPLHHANLLAIQTIKQQFNTKVGFSDHTLGCEASAMAIALGATVIEKHITLDKSLEGPDHLASMDAAEFESFVKVLRRAEEALGSGIKIPTTVEQKNKIAARKSIVANSDIQIGEIFSELNLISKRPGNGISPMQWDILIGKKATQNYVIDDLISKLEL
jgi:N,N'-diacetyllegionaminate synthase